MCVRVCGALAMCVRRGRLSMCVWCVGYVCEERQIEYVCVCGVLAMCVRRGRMSMCVCDLV